MEKIYRIEDFVFDEELRVIVKQNDKLALEQYKGRYGCPEVIDDACLLLKYLKIKQVEYVSQEECDETFRCLQGNVKRKSLVRKISIWSVSVACSIAILFVLFFQIPNFQIADKPDMFAMLDSLEIQNEVRVTLGGAEVVAFNGDTVELSAQGNVLVGGDEKINSDETKADFLTVAVPSGKRIRMEFADGTGVWVNSNSKFISSKIFKKNKREIFIDGEVFAEVASKERPTPFIVHTKMIDVKVLGTKFNVNTRKWNAESSVVLVEGSVEISTKKEERLLQPGQGVFLHNDRKEKKNVDVEMYTCWKDGYMKVSGKPLADILMDLSHYYGVQITLKDTALWHDCYYGKLELQDSLETVLCNLSPFTSCLFHVEKDGDEIQIISKQ